MITKIETRQHAGDLDQQAREARAGRPGTRSRPAARRGPTAILPNAVADAGRDDDAAPDALVHDGAHERARRAGRRPSRRPRRARRTSRPAATRPVSTASSHSSCVASSSRRSAGTTSPTRSATTSPGTRSRDVDAALARRRARPAPRGGCRRAARRPRFAARYSLTKPSPTLSTTIAAMIAASVGSPVRPETAAAASSRISSGLRSCRISTPAAVTRCVCSTFGPNVRSLLRLRLAEPRLRDVQDLQHLARQVGCAREIERADARFLRGDLNHRFFADHRGRGTDRSWPDILRSRFGDIRGGGPDPVHAIILARVTAQPQSERHARLVASIWQTPRSQEKRGEGRRGSNLRPTRPGTGFPAHPDAQADGRPCWPAPGGPPRRGVRLRGASNPGPSSAPLQGDP